MRKRQLCRPESLDAPPEQAAVEQAIRRAVERLTPKPAEARPTPPKPGSKPRRSTAPPA